MNTDVAVSIALMAGIGFCAGQLFRPWKSVGVPSLLVVLLPILLAIGSSSNEPMWKLPLGQRMGDQLVSSLAFGVLLAVWAGPYLTGAIVGAVFRHLRNRRRFDVIQ